ncbi:hypothetical protein OF83DRAFT_776723 [Amylostereum chailletii]|nr:hypothetical protein OF83DRAFT_776723 [Amylostereum chailletii]
MERCSPSPVSMPEPALDDSLQAPHFPIPSPPTQLVSTPIASPHNKLSSSSASTSPGYLNPLASFDGTTAGVQTSSFTRSQTSFSTYGSRKDPQPSSLIPSSNPSSCLVPTIPGGQDSITDFSAENDGAASNACSPSDCSSFQQSGGLRPRGLAAPPVDGAPINSKTQANLGSKSTRPPASNQHTRPGLPGSHSQGPQKKRWKCTIM